MSTKPSKPPLPQEANLRGLYSLAIQFLGAQTTIAQGAAIL